MANVTVSTYLPPISTLNATSTQGRYMACVQPIKLDHERCVARTQHYLEAGAEVEGHILVSIDHAPHIQNSNDKRHANHLCCDDVAKEIT